MLQRAREHGVTVYRGKIQFGTSVSYAGFVIARENGETVIRPDEKLLTTIRKFPEPENVTQVKGFQGMLGQIAPFNPDKSMGLFEMKKLLKKNVAFTVTEVMRKEIEEAKKNFGSKYQRLYAFDPPLRTYLITDVSY